MSASARPPLSPLGTARQRLDPRPAYPATLLSAVAEGDVPEELAFLAWQAAAWAEDLPAADRGALLEIFVRLLVAVDQGSTRIRLDAGELEIARRAAAVIGPPGGRRPFVLEGQHLYPQRLLACEDRVVAAIRARAQAARPWDPDVARAAIDAVVSSAVPRPSSEQAAAVEAALSSRLAVIAGGPGTGKTTIVVAIVRALARLGVPPAAVALAAPTGKAANRLEEAVRAGLAGLATRAPADDALAAALPPAETLHRLLGYAPRAGLYHHHENNRLAARVVIVDESSMIALPLMERLLRALADEATLVLLGDADQLPSVEAGAVFRDLGPLAVRLAQSHRMDPTRPAGRQILAAAQAVNGGDMPALMRVSAARTRAQEVSFAGVELVPGSERDALLARWHERGAADPEVRALAEAIYELRDTGFVDEDRRRLERLHAHLGRRRVLAVTRGRVTGVDALNATLQAGSGPFAPGDPVMAIRNDYDRRLWNGDQGVVVRVREGGRGPRLVAVFPVGGDLAAWDLDALETGIVLSHAITVHKAQGSEVDEALLVLPDGPVPLATRELVYTAITRSRTSVVICGNPAVLAAAVATPIGRSSGLGEKLSARA